MGAVVGIDIGQKRDPTAIAVVEPEDRREGIGQSRQHYVVRHLERLPLGTLYPAVAQRIRRLIWRLEQRCEASPEVYVDATGVGAPVVDLLREATPHADISAVFFTHGDQRSEDSSGIKLGKAYLVSRLQTLLQTHRLHLPRTSEAWALAQELQDYEIRVDENANDRYGAFRVGTHDDLVTALGLAVQSEVHLGEFCF